MLHILEELDKYQKPVEHPTKTNLKEGLTLQKCIKWDIQWIQWYCKITIITHLSILFFFLRGYIYIYNELYETNNIFLAYKFPPSGFSDTFSPGPGGIPFLQVLQAGTLPLKLLDAKGSSNRFVFPVGFFPLKKKGAPVNLCLKPIH